MILLDLVRRTRDRLADLGGDQGGNIHWEDDDTGCLWKNLELVQYFNDAQIEYTKRIPLVDTENFALTLRSGIHTYELDPVILAIQQVYHVENAHVLTKTAHEFLYPGVNPAPVSTYLENLHDLRLTVLGTPTAPGTLRLTVQRLPIDPLVWAQRKTQEPEIPGHFHPALMEYAAYLAFMVRDADSHSPELATLALQNFDRMIGPERSAVDLRWSQHLANRRPRCAAQFM